MIDEWSFRRGEPPRLYIDLVGAEPGELILASEAILRRPSELTARRASPLR